MNSRDWHWNSTVQIRHRSPDVRHKSPHVVVVSPEMSQFFFTDQHLDITGRNRSLRCRTSCTLAAAHPYLHFDPPPPKKLLPPSKYYLNWFPVQRLLGEISQFVHPVSRHVDTRNMLGISLSLSLSLPLSLSWCFQKHGEHLCLSLSQSLQKHVKHLSLSLSLSQCFTLLVFTQTTVMP